MGNIPTHLNLCLESWVTFFLSLICPFLSMYVPAKLLQSCPTLCISMDYSLPGASIHGNSPGKITGVGCHFLLRGIFPAQGLNPCLLCLLHWQAVLYHQHHLGSPSMYHFSDKNAVHIKTTQKPNEQTEKQTLILRSLFSPQVTKVFRTSSTSFFLYFKL